MKTFKLLIIYSFCILLSSCGNYIDQKNPSRQSPSANQEKQTLDFATVKKLVFEARCVSCHAQYENYSGVVRELTAIQNSVAAGRMPKAGGPLTEAQRSTLDAWISQGAQEKNGETSQPPKVTPLEPRWESIAANIIFPKCLVCHNPQGQAKFLDLSDRQTIFAQRNYDSGGGKLLDMDNVEDSYLLSVIQDEAEPMPPKQSNIPLLTPEELRALTDWIRLGLP